MSFYPQTGNGVVTQFPFSRTRHWRAISNQLESGEAITLPDPSGGQVMWNLRYEDLSDAEVSAITGLFASCQGQFGSFTFVDPLANLLGWSEALSNAAWQASQLSITSGAADPMGTQRASTISNQTSGELSISQSLGISGDYVSCFSLYVRSAIAGAVAIQRDSTRSVLRAETQWTRIYLSGTGIAGAAQSTFSLVLEAGQTLQVFGLQVEAQPWPSPYKPAIAASGIYEESYFAVDELTVTGTAPGLSRASINLVSRI